MRSEATSREAALTLQSLLRDRVPVLAVGVGSDGGNPLLLVYLQRRLRSSESDSIPVTWQDFPVRTSLMGRVEPTSDPVRARKYEPD